MVFGLVGLACAAFLLYVGLKADKDPSSTRWGPDAKWHALWVANIACVELSEFVIWLNVLPFFDEQGIHPPNGGVCPTWNKIGTFGVYFFGFANWSWLIGVWCYKTCEGTERKKAYYVYSGFSILVSVFWWCATCDLSCTTNLAHGDLTHHPPSPCVRAAILAGEIFDIGVGFVMQAAGGRQPVFISVTDSTTYVGPLANQGGIAEDLGAMKVQTCSFNERRSRVGRLRRRRGVVLDITTPPVLPAVRARRARHIRHHVVRHRPLVHSSHHISRCVNGGWAGHVSCSDCSGVPAAVCCAAHGHRRRPAGTHLVRCQSLRAHRRHGSMSTQ